MIQLSPQENFPIVYALWEKNDTSTYYVQAKVRNAETDVLLATVNLTDLGWQRFRGIWQVKGDPMGYGYYVTIEVTVYTDSGYTTVTPNYYRVTDTYLVQQRLPAHKLMGGGGIVSIDYEKIKKMIEETVDKIDIPKADFPKLKEIEKAISLNVKDYLSEFKDTRSEIKDVGDLVKSIDIPIPEKVNLKPIDSQLEDVKKLIRDIKIPESQKVDLTTIIEKLGVDYKNLIEVLNNQAEFQKQIITALSSKLDLNSEDIKKLLPKKINKIKKRNDIKLKFLKLKYG